MPTFNNLRELYDYLGEKFNREVQLDDVADREFMDKYTPFCSIADFFASSGLHIKTNEDLLNADREILDKFVSDHTQFDGWGSMYSAAKKWWVEKQLKSK